VRQAAGAAFRTIFQQWKKEGEGKYSNEAVTGLPESFDWVRSDWQTRRATQEQWKQWWAQHGVDTLRRAHPFVAADTSR
jgi:LPS sulfotransferase NodH